MGLAILIIYLPLLILASKTAFVLSAYPQRMIAKSSDSPKGMLGYVLGAALAILVTFYVIRNLGASQHGDWSIFVDQIAASLVTPLLIGISLIAAARLVARTNLVLYGMIVGALRATVAIPFIAILAMYLQS